MAVEIPGFYFDEKKKRYFKITNGDQRHNAQYTNNSHQARKRRKQLLNNENTQSHPNKQDNAQISKRATRAKYHPSTTDLLVNTKMGIASISPGWPALMHLQACEEMVSFSDHQLWLLQDTTKLVCFENGVLSVFSTGDYITRCNPLATAHVAYTSVQHLVMAGEWLMVKESTHRLLRYKFSEASAELSFISCIEESFEGSDFGFFVSDRFLFLVNDTTLILQPLFEPHRELVIESPVKDRVQYVAMEGEVLVVADHKSVYLRELWDREKHLHFEKTIHHVFLDNLSRLKFGDAEKPRFLRLTVVTTDAVHIYSFDMLHPKLDAGGESISIKISNDNIAMPIVFRMADNMLIEISGSSFHWIDLLNGKAEVILVESFANARQHQDWWRSDYFNTCDRLFLLSSDRLNEIV